jgi:hypothetical protein
VVTTTIPGRWPPDLLLAEQTAAPLLERLDPPRRAAVVMALLALVLTGLLLVSIVMLGARWVRRQARHTPNSQRTNTHDRERGNPQLSERLREIVPEAKSDETVHIDRATSDTRVDR